jgi:hypothetical protein
MTVTNTGSVTEPRAQLTNMVRAQPWVIQAVSGLPTQGSCQGSYPVACDLGPLAPGASAAVTVVLVPRLAGTFTSAGSAKGLLPDSNGADNEFTVTAPTTP